MSNFVAQWDHLKKEFGKNVLTLLQEGKDDVPGDVRKSIIELVKTETGMTPALKLVDAAIGKEQRATAMKALTKVHGVIEATNKVFVTAGVNAMNGAMEATPEGAQALGKIADCVKTFNKEFHEFETSIAEAIEHLQEAKGGVKIAIFSLEGDMIGAVERFKKNIKAFASLEKKFKVMDYADKTAKPLESYSVAVARSQVKEARKTLMAFFDAVDELDNYGKKVQADKSKPDEDYLEAIEKLCTAVRGIKNGRGNDSLRNLDELIAQGH